MSLRVIRPEGDTIVWRQIESRIMTGARDALRATGAFAYGRAQEYVPVRDVFRHGRSRLDRNKYYSGGMNRRGAFRVEGVVRGVKRSGSGSWSAMRRTYATPQSQQKFLREFHKQRPKNRQIMAIMSNREQRVRSHPRAYKPLFGRGANAEYVPNARVLTTKEAGGGVFLDVQDEGEKDLGLGGLRPPTIGSYASNRGPRKTNMANYLNRRGRHEVKRLMQAAVKLREESGGRVSFSEINRVLTTPTKTGRLPTFAARVTGKGDDTRMMLGGRLRDSITLGPIVEDSGSMSIDVYTDPMQQDYAAYQEWGTSRHPAQPFMRPALYESRMRLVTEMRKAMRGV